MTAHRFVNDTFCFAGAETRAIRIYKKRLPFLIFSPLLEIPIYIGKKFFRPFHSHNAEFAEIFAVHKSYRTLP